MTFETRALELHASAHIWNPHVIDRVLAFMERNELNTLVLHEVQILERLVYPGKVFGSTDADTNISERYRSTYLSLYRLTPGRRSKPFHYVETVRGLIRRAARRGIQVYLNNKELFFPDVLLELRPELTKDGILCPTEPFWLEYLAVKYRELYEDLPDLAGTITAPGTGESRLAFSGNRCTCERCARTTASQWYTDVVGAIHGPTAAAGKRLVIRDFVFDKAAHDELATAFDALPADIAVCLKNTPHDYYPTFPDNPRLGDFGSREQWVEYDAMGQYFGWGVAPAILVDDGRARYDVARRSGTTGVLIRVDWETLDGHSCFDTPNLLNLYALSRLAVEPAADERDIYRRWLVDERLVDDDSDPATIERSVDWAVAALRPSLSIVAGSLFADGCVVSDSSSFPVSLDHLFWLAEHKNSLQDWDPGKRGALDPTTANVDKVIAEKDRALARWREVRTAMGERNPGLTEIAYEDLLRRFDVFGTYIEGFRHLMKVAMAARHVREHADASDERVAGLLVQGLAELRSYLDRIRDTPDVDWFPASHLVNADRLQVFYDDATRVGSSAAAAGGALQGSPSAGAQP